MARHGKEELEAALAEHGLCLNGGFAPEPRDGLDATTLALVSPASDFWGIFSASPELGDGAPDPLDRWSARILTAIAADFGATAHFPFGPAAGPFLAWARRSGAAWPSPVPLLVSGRMGLDTSYRGALALPFAMTFPPSVGPCGACAEPCLTACPAEALVATGYDVAACQTYLRARPDSACREAGCLVRRACPASIGQPPAQARFHMAAFLS
ncbi:MAG: ferredoxin [Pseudomonadota bacterium]